MTLEQLQNDMAAALKSKDTVRRKVLSSAVSAVKKAAIDKRAEATEMLVDEVLLKEKKILEEMINTCPIDRKDLCGAYTEELRILNEYCLKLLSDPEAIRKQFFILLEPSGIAPVKTNKGAIMKIVMPYFKGKADMKIVNQVISEVLA